MIESQKESFIRLYEAALGYFSDDINRDESPWNMIRLHMLTAYADDNKFYLATKDHMPPVSNVEERRAIFRAALSEAVIRHSRAAPFYENAGRPSQKIGTHIPDMVIRPEDIVPLKEKPRGPGRPPKVVA